MKLPSWLSRLFADLTPRSVTERSVNTWETEIPPVQPPKSASPLSCFAQGIIRSLETEPEQWERSLVRDRYVHSTLFVYVMAEPDRLLGYEPGQVTDFATTPAERKAIYAALLKHVIEPERAKAQEGLNWLAEQKRKDLAARYAAFERKARP